VGGFWKKPEWNNYSTRLPNTSLGFVAQSEEISCRT